MKVNCLKVLLSDQTKVELFDKQSQQIQHRHRISINGQVSEKTVFICFTGLSRRPKMCADPPDFTCTLDSCY